MDRVINFPSLYYTMDTSCNSLFSRVVHDYTYENVLQVGLYLSRVHSQLQCTWPQRYSYIRNWTDTRYHASVTIITICTWLKWRCFGMELLTPHRTRQFRCNIQRIPSQDGKRGWMPSPFCGFRGTAALYRLRNCRPAGGASQPVALHR